MNDLNDRRQKRRYPLAVPIRTTVVNLGNVTGTTRDMCSSGVYFVTQPDHWSEGASIEVVVEIPSEITLSNSITVLCHGSIVRLEPQPDRIGIAMKIEHFELLGSA